MSGGVVGYKVKWVEDHFGISRKALCNYEKLGLMPPNIGGKYRDYSDEDIDRIWSIKILQGVGYSLAEIRELKDNKEAYFYKSISDKVVELERKRDDITNFIEFAKTIKLTGRVPTTKQVGSIRYSEFMEYSRENWNFYIEPKAASYLDVMELIQDAKEQELSEIDVDRLESLAKLMGIIKKCNIHIR